MINNKYTEITDEDGFDIMRGAFRLSYLMTDAGEKKHIGFFATTALLNSNLGSFHVFTVDNEPVAYALLGFGVSETQTARRLCYFAVERDMRNKGYARKAIELLIKDEVDIPAGFVTSCHPELRDFYESLGFEYACVSAECGNEYISMAMFDKSVMTIEQCMNLDLATTQESPEAEEMFNKVKKNLKMCGIKPPKNKKGSKGK